jgi:hypothetical protein
MMGGKGKREDMIWLGEKVDRGVRKREGTAGIRREELVYSNTKH